MEATHCIAALQTNKQAFQAPASNVQQLYKSNATVEQLTSQVSGLFPCLLLLLCSLRAAWSRAARNCISSSCCTRATCPLSTLALLHVWQSRVWSTTTGLDRVITLVFPFVGLLNAGLVYAQAQTP